VKPTISVIIPALNEEKNIQGTVQEVLAALDDRFSDFELVLVDDGSVDTTGAIMDQLVSDNVRMRVAHNSHPTNLGGAYKTGLAIARMEYVIMVPGDNQFSAANIAKVLDHVGQADMVIQYTTNQNVRPLPRQLGSRLFTAILNCFFRLRISYYNGTVVHRRELLNTIVIRTDGFAYQAEAIVKLLRAGHTHVDVGTEIRERASGRSTALRPKNLAAVFKAIWNLVWEVYFRR